MAMQIITSSEVPDGTYFRTADAEPELEGERLTIWSGTGRSRSWGRPGVTSTVVLNADDLVAVHVGFFHKHGGGQFWRYFRHDGQAWQQVAWPQLGDTERERILVAYEDRAPSFARIPGKLRVSYKKPATETRTTYKIVEVVDSKFFSVFDGKTEYTIGKRLAEKAVSEHGGGYYSYPSVEGVEEYFHARKLFPARCYDEPMQLALIECEISGTILEYGEKFASTYLKPVRVIRTFEYVPELAKVS